MDALWITGAFVLFKEEKRMAKLKIKRAVSFVMATVLSLADASGTAVAKDKNQK